jgi:hypothetical protein
LDVEKPPYPHKPIARSTTLSLQSKPARRFRIRIAEVASSVFAILLSCSITTRVYLPCRRSEIIANPSVIAEIEAGSGTVVPNAAEGTAADKTEP